MRYKSLNVFVSSLLFLFACGALICFSFSFAAPRGFTSGGGRVTFAYGSSSSNAVFVNKDDFADGTVFVGYKAVSAYYPGENATVIRNIVQKYAAVEVLAEKTSDVTCYYFYSDKIPVYKVLYVDSACVGGAFEGVAFEGVAFEGGAGKNAAGIGDASKNAVCGKRGESMVGIGGLLQSLLLKSISRAAVKVNIHVAVSGCGVTVGCPMIYCGY